MSGKVITLLLLAGCSALVGLALVNRSVGTSQVRGLFSPQGAKLIQRAELVHLRRAALSGDEVVANATWRDISRAQGLIHLRATLVDDRYYVWSTKSPFSLEILDSKRDMAQFRFEDSGQATEVWFEPQSGCVYSPSVRLRVQLIDSSRQAVTQYLRELDKLADRP